MPDCPRRGQYLNGIYFPEEKDAGAVLTRAARHPRSVTRAVVSALEREFIREMKPKTAVRPVAHTVPVLRKAVRVLAAVAEGSGEPPRRRSRRRCASRPDVLPDSAILCGEGWLRPGPRGTFALSFGLVPFAASAPAARVAVRDGARAADETRADDRPDGQLRAAGTTP